MSKKRLAGLLKDEMDYALSELSKASGLIELVRASLIQTGHGLNSKTKSEMPWPLLPLIVCGMICGKEERALPAAAAMQFFFAAGDVFDDIEDMDSSASFYAKYGLAAAVSTASTLLMLGELSLTKLKEQDLDSETIVKIIENVNSHYITSCAGQHLDLSLNNRYSISEDDYLKIIAMKSASQLECSCCVGALCGGAEQRKMNLIASFGRNLGLALQLVNDIRGIVKGNDIIKHKVTFPIIYGLTQTKPSIKKQLKISFANRNENAKDPASIREVLFQSGAIHYTIVKTEYFKQLASDNLSEMEKMGVNVKQLRPFTL
jgi:geranylgeranyl pyrophosphate synthase